MPPRSRAEDPTAATIRQPARRRREAVGNRQRRARRGRRARRPPPAPSWRGPRHGYRCGGGRAVANPTAVSDEAGAAGGAVNNRSDGGLAARERRGSHRRRSPRGRPVWRAGGRGAAAAAAAAAVPALAPPATGRQPVRLTAAANGPTTRAAAAGASPATRGLWRWHGRVGNTPPSARADASTPTHKAPHRRQPPATAALPGALPLWPPGPRLAPAAVALMCRALPTTTSACPPLRPLCVVATTPNPSDCRPPQHRRPGGAAAAVPRTSATSPPRLRGQVGAFHPPPPPSMRRGLSHGLLPPAAPECRSGDHTPPPPSPRLVHGAQPRRAYSLHPSRGCRRRYRTPATASVIAATVAAAPPPPRPLHLIPRACGCRCSERLTCLSTPRRPAGRRVPPDDVAAGPAAAAAAASAGRIPCFPRARPPLPPPATLSLPVASAGSARCTAPARRTAPSLCHCRGREPLPSPQNAFA